MSNPSTKERLSAALWRIYRRAERPFPFQTDDNLPWDEPAFSERMLREHLDENHGAASRQAHERALQIEWLWRELGLEAGQHLFDVTCGPGLYAVPFAERGVRVTGVDFSPAAIGYANELAEKTAVSPHPTFIQEDIRQTQMPSNQFDAAILLYGQLAVMQKEEAQSVLKMICQSLKPAGKLVVVLLDQERVDKSESNWWFTDDTGLWGNAPFLHLGERFWDEERKVSTERFTVLHLETGQLDEILLSDQTYAVEEMVGILKEVGFTAVTPHPAWANLPLYDAEEWVVYVAQK